jgi:hypothetical protein
VRLWGVMLLALASCLDQIVAQPGGTYDFSAWHAAASRLSPRASASSACVPRTTHLKATGSFLTTSTCVVATAGNAAGVAQPLGELGTISDVTSAEWTRVSLSSPHHAGVSPVLFSSARMRGQLAWFLSQGHR